MDIFSTHKKKSEAGFTIPELLVGVFVFTTVGGIAINLFISSLGIQRQSLATESLVSRLSFASETMSRVLRGAQKDLGAGCISYGINYELPGGNDSRIKFLDSGGTCREIFLENGQVKETAGASTTVLTPAEITVDTLKFSLRGQPQTDAIQPRVTFSLVARTTGTKPGAEQTIQLQTTVSQRRIDAQNE